MNKQYRETQKSIKQCIQQFVDAGPLDRRGVSIELLGKSAGYLHTQMRPDRLIGAIALQHIASVIPIPKHLIKRAEAEFNNRLLIRGERMQATRKGMGPTWTETVQMFRQHRPIEHQPWGRA